MKIINTKSFELSIFTRGDDKVTKFALLLPGRLDTKDYVNFPSHANFLASKGFFVVAIDPPGTWESPGSLDIYSTSNYIKAVHEVIEFYGSKPTLLVGHSRGAAVAILAGTNNSNVIGMVSIMANFGQPTAPGAEAA